ncbi:zinc finger MYM-type protein 1-like [Myzus persicae]|uniref:zinc finger MYM-type protein 1-like n=1 Tax=Myzus persicae TaxID=13164 RepID=UPI000B935329|nr:zinc finger MYM-type protein 1-like [Myzus persicae]
MSRFLQLPQSSSTSNSNNEQILNKQDQSKPQSVVENVFNENLDIALPPSSEKSEKPIPQSSSTSNSNNEQILNKQDQSKPQSVVENVFNENLDIALPPSSEKSEKPISHNLDSTTILNVVKDIDVLSDPYNWPDSINSYLRVDLVKLGPRRNINIKYPISSIDKTERQFSNSLYSRKLSNGEFIDRQWLVYSVSSDRVYCFCCKLFPSHATNLRISSLATVGLRDWKHISERLKTHEISQAHIKSAIDWSELRQRLGKLETIDKAHQILLEKEKNHWKEVLKRIIAAIHFLAKHNDAFRGNTDILYQPNNGKFLGLMEMFAKFDPFIFEHLKRIRDHKTHTHYLGHDIQNELIEIMASEINKKIIQKIKSAKYYAVIMDCTPDISRQEQLSLVIRIVDMSLDDEFTNPTIKEFFIDFTNICSSTGLNLSNVLLKKLKDYDIDIADCRGQGYDNGANMVGQYQGVQSRILNQNPRALFMPCWAHSLNLVLKDTAKTSARAMHFFGTIERIFTIFSASTARWGIFKKHCHQWTVKKWSETRWESRHSSVKAIRFQVKEIIDALDEINETTNDSMISSETNSLTAEMCTYNFLISFCIWYSVLNEVNIVSKSLQNPQTNLNTSTKLLKALQIFLTEYRNDGFNAAKREACDLANKLKIEPAFKIQRLRKKKQMFGYEGADDVIQNTEDEFKCNYFLVIVDGAISAITKRFDQINTFNDVFGFLYDVEKLCYVPDLEIFNCCKDLEIRLSDNDKKDLNGYDLFEEILIFRHLIDKNTTPLQVLSEIKKTNAFPNLNIALRIMLTIPLTSAGAERTFSKLKLIKTYLRSTMSQQRLTGLATISIEKELQNN